MHGDMIGVVALDFILWVVLTSAVSVSFVIDILSMDLDDPAADMSGFGIPGNVVCRL